MTTQMHADKALSIVDRFWGATPLATLKSLERQLMAIEIWTGEQILHETEFLHSDSRKPLAIRFTDGSAICFHNEAHTPTGWYVLYPRD